MKIGFFGTGNMGSAIAQGIRHHSSKHEIYLYNPTIQKTKNLSMLIDGIVVEELQNMPADLDWYFLTFKPQSLEDFHYDFLSSAKIISALAGVTIHTLSKKFKTDKILRLMPNTPSCIGEGVNLLFAHFPFDDLLPLINATGKSFVLSSEELIDLLTPYSGSGPALIFEFALQFEKNILKITNDESLAREIVTQLFIGSSALIKNGFEQNKSLSQLRDEVTSKKGVTFEALKVLEKSGFAQTMQTAFDQAYKRALEIQKGI